MYELTKSHSTHMADDCILSNAPSVFATGPDHEVSDRYGFIPTIDVVNGLRAEGWYPVDAAQKKTRIAAKREFTKHLIRFRRLDDDILVNDSAVELILTNSHDRSSAFNLHAGIFRMVCANGIVIADSTFQKVSVTHSKYATDRVIEGAYSIVENVPLITDEIDTMSGTQLTDQERRIFASTALDYILPEPKEGEPVILNTHEQLVNQMLRPKRREDTSSDLWSTFNVIQEKALRGGLSITKFNEKKRYNRTRRSTTREIKSLDKNIKLNKALWSMANEMQKLKTA